MKKAYQISVNVASTPMKNFLGLFGGCHGGLSGFHFAPIREVSVEPLMEPAWRGEGQTAGAGKGRREDEEMGKLLLGEESIDCG